MVTKQFYYIRGLYFNTRQDTRHEERVYSKLNIGNNIKTGAVFLNNGKFNTEKINKDRTKNAVQKLQNI